MGCGSELLGNAANKITSPKSEHFWVSAALASFMQNNGEGHLLITKHSGELCVLTLE